MRKSVEQEIQSGLRLGVGLGVFLIGALLLGLARDRLDVMSGHNRSGWSDWVVWAEFASAVGLLLSTVHVWYQWLAGCLLFGTVKGIIALATGAAVFPLRQIPATRIASLIVVFYCLASLALMARFIHRRPSTLDRIALTVYFLCLLPFGTTFPSVFEIVGLGGLLLSFLLYKWQVPQGKRSDNSVLRGAD